MDDASLVYSLVPSMEASGIFRQAWEFAKNDIGWGMFRPIYPLMAYVLYKPGMLTAPWVTFAINTVFSAFLVFGFAFIWGRILDLKWKVILLINATFLYQYDLIQHPSLQEKIVLLSGLLLFWVAWFLPRKIAFPLFAVVAAWGFLTKASFVIYFSVGFFLLLARFKESLLDRRMAAWGGVLVSAIVGVVAVMLLGKIAAQGSYTSQYDYSKVVPNILSIHGLIFLTPLSLALIRFSVFWRETWARPEVLAPAIGVLVFLLLFLPWGISGYIQAIVGPLISALICQLVGYFLPLRQQKMVRIAFCLLAIFVCAYRVPTMLLRLHDIGKIVALEKSALSGGLNMPCIEGSDSVRSFLKEKEITVNFHSKLPKNMSGLWLFDGAMCPLPGGVMDPPGCSQEFVYQSIWNKSYRVVRLKCDSAAGKILESPNYPFFVAQLYPISLSS